MNPTSLHVAKTRFFEWYARSLWNAHRLLVRSRIARRCRNCGVSELRSPLRDGLCADCRAPAATAGSDTERADSAEPGRALDEVLRDHAGRGAGQYDALILVSGGKDSAVLLHRLTREFPLLRLLGLTVDTGFLSPVAVDNVNGLIGRFGVDHAFVRPHPGLFIKGFRHALTHLGPEGCYGNVDRLDGDLVHDIARNLAAVQRIPLLLSGVSRKQVEIIFGVHHFEMPRERELAPRAETGGIPLTAIYQGDELLYWWNPRRFEPEHAPRLLFPLYAWNIEEHEIRRIVTELGLIRPGRDSPLVTNNLLLPLMGFVDVARLGYSSFEGEFAGMIREGKAPRRLWRNIFEMMEYSAKTGWLIGAEVRNTLKQLDLTPEEVGLGALGKVKK